MEPTSSQPENDEGPEPSLITRTFVSKRKFSGDQKVNITYKSIMAIMVAALMWFGNDKLTNITGTQKEILDSLAQYGNRITRVETAGEYRDRAINDLKEAVFGKRSEATPHAIPGPTP